MVNFRQFRQTMLTAPSDAYQGEDTRRHLDLCGVSLPPSIAGKKVGIQREGERLLFDYGYVAISNWVSQVAHLNDHDRGKLPLVFLGALTLNVIPPTEHLGEALLGFWCQDPEGFMTTRNSAYGIMVPTEDLEKMVRLSHLIRGWVDEWPDDFPTWTDGPTGWTWMVEAEAIPIPSQELLKLWVEVAYRPLKPYVKDPVIPDSVLLFF